MHTTPNHHIAARKLEAMDLLMQQARDAIASGDRREARLLLTAILRCPQFKDPAPTREPEPKHTPEPATPPENDHASPPPPTHNPWDEVWASDHTYRFPGIYTPEMLAHAGAAYTLPAARNPGDPYIIPTPAPAPFPPNLSPDDIRRMIIRGVPIDTHTDLGPHADILNTHPNTP